MPDPVIVKGKRVALTGRTGSGKTYLGQWLMLKTAFHWVVLDSKHDPGFDLWRPYDGLLTSRALRRAWVDHQIVVVRPKPHQSRADILDAYLGDLHGAFTNFGTFIDELYQVVRRGQPGDGLTGLVTRGRARGQSVIMGAQRPSRVPLFMFSEADFIASMSLSLPDDRHRVYEYIGSPRVLRKLPARQWYWFDVAKEDLHLYDAVSINPASPA